MWQLWFFLLVLFVLIALRIHASRTKKKIAELTELSLSQEGEREKVVRLYGEIEDMLDHFEQYVRELTEEQEKSRKEMLEMSRGAVLMMQRAELRPRDDGAHLPDARASLETPTDDVALGDPGTHQKLSSGEQKQLESLAKPQKVRFLMARSWSLDEIAKELKMGKGEIQLIVDLDRR